MKETDYLKLKKPDPVDFYDVQDFNDNADAIDEEFASLISDETIELFGLWDIDISGDNSGDSGEDSGGDSIEEGNIATDEEVDEMIKDIFG